MSERLAPKPAHDKPSPERLIRPFDAAGLILLRGRRDTPEILLGRRHSKTAFLPDIYVVPGGRVDAEDMLPSGFPEPIHPAVAGHLAAGCRRPPLAFLRAALRETHEETGLLVGSALATPLPGAGTGVWSAYGAAGLAPEFARLDFVLRAITPRQSRRRYNTRFFLADGSQVAGELRGNGELLDLAWRPTGALDKLEIVDVTWEVIRSAMRRWRDRAPAGSEAPKLLIYRNNTMLLRALPTRPPKSAPPRRT